MKLVIKRRNRYTKSFLRTEATCAMHALSQSQLARDYFCSTGFIRSSSPNGTSVSLGIIEDLDIGEDLPRQCNWFEIDENQDGGIDIRAFEAAYSRYWWPDNTSPTGFHRSADPDLFKDALLLNSGTSVLGIASQMFDMDVGELVDRIDGNSQESSSHDWLLKKSVTLNRESPYKSSVHFLTFATWALLETVAIRSCD